MGQKKDLLPRTIVFPVIFCIVSLLFVCLISSCSDSGPKNVVKDYFKHLNAGKAEAAQKLVAEPNVSAERLKVGNQAMVALLKYSKGGDKTMIGAACNAAVEKGGYAVKVIDVDSVGDTAIVKVNVNLNWMHPSWDTEFKLSRQNEQWVITNVPYTFVMTGLSSLLYNDFKTRVLVGLPENYLQ